MNEDYVWDKSGEPDPDIEQLERALGRLRYKRPEQPLPLPIIRRSSVRSRFWSSLAVAAAICILLLAGGLWLAVRRPATTVGTSPVAAGETPEAQSTPLLSGPAPQTGPINPTATNKPKADERQLPFEVNHSKPSNTIRRTADYRQNLTMLNAANRLIRRRRELQVRRDGEIAKEQLINALLITSDKLNTVKKRIQGDQARGPIS